MDARTYSAVLALAMASVLGFPRPHQPGRFSSTLLGKYVEGSGNSNCIWRSKNYTGVDPNQEVGGRDLYAGGSCRHIPRELFGHTSGTRSYLENKYEHEDHAFG